MKELEIIIDQGGIEKKVIISSGIISFDNNNKSICSKYDITTIVIAGNGEFPPPFLKGSKVLRDIRKSNVESFNNWKLIFPLQLNNHDFLSNDIYKLRIRVFTQVLSEWLSKNDYYNKAVISYGEGIRVDLIERAWDVQAEESKSDIAEFGEAIILRSKSLAYINDLLHSTKRISFKDALKRAMETFSVSPPSLVADLIQSRALSEAISYEFCEKHGLGAQSSNLFSYIQRIEESKTVSPWVTSYLHVIRQLGNEAAHYKSEILRRPEKPVGKDLIVIHAALNRILAFCIDEKL